MDRRNIELHTIDIDGQNNNRLTEPGEDNHQAAWSPDGSKIVFTSGRDGNEQIYIMNSDGTDQQRLTNTQAEDNTPQFTPNGSQIVYLSNNDVYLMNVDGTNPRLIVADAYEKPVISPDGTNLAVTLKEEGQNHPNIYISGIEGENLVNLTEDQGWAYSPCFSPDGQRIAYNSNISGNSDIYIMNINGSDKSLITNHTNADKVACFFPDGNKLLFESYRDSTILRLFSIDLTSMVVEKLTSERSGTWNPKFTPDGSTIIYDVFGDISHAIYVMNRNGTDRRMIYEQPRHPCKPQIQPH
jgi:Tol biopolymer transport system component